MTDAYDSPATIPSIKTFYVRASEREGLISVHLSEDRLPTNDTSKQIQLAGFQFERLTGIKVADIMGRKKKLEVSFLLEEL